MTMQQSCNIAIAFMYNRAVNRLDRLKKYLPTGCALRADFKN